MRRGILTLILAFLASILPAFGDDGRAADRAQLLGILKDVETGINERRIDLMLRHIDDQAVVTWLNAEVSKGPEGVRAYFAKMVGDAPGTVLSKYVTHPKLSDQAVFHGDVAIAHGTTEDEFTPHHRSVFRFSSRWTASLRKHDGQWRIIALNLSANAFNNALTAELQRLAWLAGAGGLGGGLLLAAAWAYFRRRKG
jgi:ketosteroid isomerase-like protein